MNQVHYHFFANYYWIGNNLLLKDMLTKKTVVMVVMTYGNKVTIQ